MKDSIVMGMSYIGGDLCELPETSEGKQIKRNKFRKPLIAAAAACLTVMAAVLLPLVLRGGASTGENLLSGFIAVPVSAADVYIENESVESASDQAPIRLLKPSGRNRMIIGAWEAGESNIIVFRDDCTFVVYDRCPYAPYYYEACSEGYYGIDGEIMRWYNPWESAVYNISFSLGLFGQSLTLTENESADVVRLRRTDTELRPIEEYDGGWEKAMRILVNHLDRQGCVTESVSIDGIGDDPEDVQDSRANVVAAGFGDEYDAGWWLTAVFVAGEKGFDEAAPGERVEAGFLVARNAEGWRILSRTEFRTPDGER